MLRMKKNLPVVSLQDVEHFYIVGSQHRDGILGEYNLKTDLKAALYPSEDSPEIWADLSMYQKPEFSNSDGINVPRVNIEPLPAVGDIFLVKENDGVYEYTVNTVRQPFQEVTLKSVRGDSDYTIRWSPDSENMLWVCYNLGTGNR